MATTALATGVHLRRARPEDAGVCGPICYEAFTKVNADHGFPPEMPSAEMATGLVGMLIGHPDFYDVVAEWEGRIVGSNFLDERGEVAGVGPITVAPGVQNGKIGRALMEDVLGRAHERGFAGVRLMQAAFHGRSLSLYAKLGFDAREPISALNGAPLGVSVAGCVVRRGREEDAAACDAVCRRVHGHGRGGEVRDALQMGSLVVVERGGEVTGYATGFGYFSHAVGRENLDLQALIGGAERIDGPGILVPTRNAELFRWCLAHGLRVVQPMTLMTMGMYQEPSGAYMPSVLY